MSECGQDGTSQCEESASESSAVSDEGKWVGIVFGSFVLVILLAWVVKTCKQPQRRQRVLRKLIFCYDNKQHNDNLPDVESSQQQQPSSAPPTQNGAINGNVVTGTGTGTRSQRYENGVNNYGNGAVKNAKNNNSNSSIPSSYQDETDSCGFTLEDVLRYEYEYEDDDEATNEDEDDDYDDDRKTRNGKNSSKNGKFRSRKSRISLHSLSLTLETIEEDLNEAKHTSSEPEIHNMSNEINNNDNNNRNHHSNSKGGTYSHRSMSVPARLFAMIDHNNISILEEAPPTHDDNDVVDDDDDDDDDDDEVFKNSNNDNIILNGINSNNYKCEHNKQDKINGTVTANGGCNNGVQGMTKNPKM